ncbi:reverse transcriptase domain-containing protein [Sinorhizobium meliloti]|uniref:reverse transcriptase domain-containing protein n=1 Tax=Rhizobium meliloti TaxID=382 RepID=UPI001F41DD12|nr:reverse transcriptase domain-containing protein [Sinorhizobium meliloti]
MALDALHTAIMSQRVSWVLEADIRSFFDSVDQEWLLQMVAHRIADPRILQLIKLWLRAGILKSGETYETDKGTPQGAGISPLLANIFLHYHPRPVGSSMASTPSTRPNCDRALCRRLRHGLREQG